MSVPFSENASTEVACAPSAQPARPPAETAVLAIDAIVPDPENPWGGDGEDDQGFTASIQTLGVLQPPRVRFDEVLGKWMITAGERRWRKAKASGMKTLLCAIDRQPADPVRVHKERIAENLHRRVCRPVRLAKALRTLQEQAGYSLAQLGEAIGKPDVTFISRKLSLLKFSPGVQGDVDAGLLEESTAVEIAKVKNEQQREALARRAVQEKLTRDQAIQLVSKLNGKRTQSLPGAKPLKRLRCTLPGGSLVSISCPEMVPELTTEIIRDVLEFALQEVRKAIRKQVPASALPGHFEKLQEKASDREARTSAQPQPPDAAAPVEA